MEIKIEFFQTIQSNYAYFGITSHKVAQQYPFNWRLLFGFILFGCSIVSHFIYFFREANTYMEIIDCICATSGAVITCICFMAFVFQMKTLFDSISDIEKLFVSSRSSLRLRRWKSLKKTSEQN